MRTLLQRVSSAKVEVNKKIVSEIDRGILVLLGIEAADEKEDLEWLVRKIVNMRIFEDGDGKMNHSLTDLDFDLLVVSQFTLHASTKKGNRPSFIKAAQPEKAKELYFEFLKEVEKQTGKKPKAGIFGEMMNVSLINEGPVTIWMDSKNRE